MKKISKFYNIRYSYRKHSWGSMAYSLGIIYRYPILNLGML
jgi:hypothetical protein